VTAEEYLRRVEEEVRDLPWRQRRDLVSELRGHLSELPPGTDLEARLGTPAEYAADLRAAAGLEHRRGAAAFVRARRPRNVILTVAAFVVLGLAVGSVVFIQTYQPLAVPSSSKIRRSAPVAFHPGFRFGLGINVQNNGRFMVRVLGVPYRSGPFSGLPVSARVMMSRDTGGFMKRTGRCGHVPTPLACGGFRAPIGPWEPFHPFDLKPGRERALLLVGVYGDCTDAARNLLPISVPAFPVRYSFLWRTATARIPLPKEREIIPPSGGCPSAVARSHRLDANHPAGEIRVFKAGRIKRGVRIFCDGHGVRASSLVPKRGQSAVGTADGPDGHATLRLTTRANGSVVAHCTSGDLPVP
jgi:hypothetical protein